MRILVSPQEFKGSLSARAAADAIARGLRRVLAGAEIDLLPLADGGPGTVDALVEATDGHYEGSEVHDPLGRPISARWGVLGGRGGGEGPAAVIEMAAASGLVLLSEDERDPRRASTAGTGELVLAALDGGYRLIIVGLGGSATNDAGGGMAQALGARLLDAEGRDLPSGGAALARLARLDVAGLDPRLQETEIIAATDVTNPLFGPDGASIVYGPQKGANERTALELDAALACFGGVASRDLGVSVAEIPGAGAAGGLGAGLIAFCGAEVRPGFDVVAEAAGFAERVARADLVVTGEGQLDRQTAFGKTTAGVARAAREAGKPVLALAGAVDEGPEGDASENFDAVFALSPDLARPDVALARAAEVLAEAAEAAGWWIEARRGRGGGR